MTHPVNAQAWDWDEENEGELAAHGISPEEVRQVFEGRPVWARNRRHRAGDWKMMGRTAGGRRLSIVVYYEPRLGRLRPITGWDATAGERTRYF